MDVLALIDRIDHTNMFSLSNYKIFFQMPGGGDGPGQMLESWKQRTPALSRLIPYFALFSTIGSLFLYKYTCLCISMVFDSYQGKDKLVDI